MVDDDWEDAHPLLWALSLQQESNKAQRAAGQLRGEGTARRHGLCERDPPGQQTWHWLRSGAVMGCLPCLLPSQQLRRLVLRSDLGTCLLESAPWVGASFSPCLTGIVWLCLWRLQPPGAISGHAQPFPSSLPWTLGNLGPGCTSHSTEGCPPSPACPASVRDPGGGVGLQGGSRLPYPVLERRRPFKMWRVGPGCGEGAPQSRSP